MEEDKYKCPLCHISHNYNNNKKIDNYNDDKYLCSSCINKLLSKENNLVFPHDFIDYKNININQINSSKNNNITNDQIKNKSINDSIIEEIRQQSKNKILVEEKKHLVNHKSLINGMQQIQNNQNISNNHNIPNNQNITSNNIENIKNEKCYVKKSIKVNYKLSEKKIKEFENNHNYTHICNIHSLPLNIICIDEKQQICSQCVLNNNHLNHKVIIEKDFIEYIKELYKIYSNIESNQKKYNNFSQEKFYVIEDINNILLESEKNLTTLKNKIINNINNQFNTILNFMNLRRKEILEKYQYSNYDISNLIETAQNWMNLVSEKLTLSNINNNNFKNINVLQMLDNDENKNIFNLINKGKQLNEKYNFIKEIYQIIDKLEIYKKEGINIKQNDEIINNIIGQSKIIYIEENQNLIKDLNLTAYNNLIKELNTKEKTEKTFKSKQKNNLDININTNNDILINYEFNKNKNKRKMLKNNIIDNKIINGEIKGKNKKHKIYFRKIPEEIGLVNFTENEFYKDKTPKIKPNTNSKINLIQTQMNSKINSISKKKFKNEMNFTELKNESSFPVLNNVSKIDKIDKKINKLLRNKTTGNMNTKLNEKNNFLKTKSKNESIELSNYNDNKININFNGHIFNYNSDSNFSINIPELNNTQKKIKNGNKEEENNNSNSNSNNKITDIFELLTPKKEEIHIKKLKSSDNPKIMRCFSFNGDTNKNKNHKKIKKKHSSNSITIKNNNSLNNTNNNILYMGTGVTGTSGNFFKNEEQTFRNFDFFGKKEKKVKTNYKTLNKNELEKYINYQMKKLKINFNRINLKDIGIKIICSIFKKNKNKKYKEIKLQGCNLCDTDFEIFSKCLIENNIIIPIINLTENKLGDDSTFTILDFIGKYHEIKSLYLSNNLFSKGIKDKIREIIKIKNNQNNVIFIQI